MFIRSLIVLAVVAVAAGCKPPTDLGQQCRLVKKNPDGGRALIIQENEIKTAANKDFVSFGSTDCENLVCVRDSAFVADAGMLLADGGLPDRDGGALGYCSNSCEVGSVCGAADPADDNDSRRRLNCRALLLDTVTLQQLCKQGKCLQGNLTSPYFCARGAIPDAGT